MREFGAASSCGHIDGFDNASLMQFNEQCHRCYDTCDPSRIPLGNRTMGAVLPGVSVPSYLGPPPAAHGVKQLAEAIHTTADSDYGEPDIDDNQSILLTDTSTHRPLQRNDELFAVEGEDSDDDHDHDEGAVTSERVKHGVNDQEGWDDGLDDGVQPDDDRQGLMGNIHARRSWVDLPDVGENGVQNGVGTDRPSRGSLSAKAGIILVRSIQYIYIVLEAIHSHIMLLPYMCATSRVYTTYSSSSRSSS